MWLQGCKTPIYSDEQKRPKSIKPNLQPQNATTKCKDIPWEKFPWSMNALHIVCIKPESTHCRKWSFPNNVKKFCINIHNCSCSCIVSFPPIGWSDTILFQSKILTETSKATRSCKHQNMKSTCWESPKCIHGTWKELKIHINSFQIAFHSK